MEWRYLPAAFSGMGLYNLMTETTAANLNVFLQYYNTDSALGITINSEEPPTGARDQGMPTTLQL